MNRLSPVQFMLIGFVLMVIGILLPFFMIAQVLESTLWLGFLAYLASFLGLVLGLIGVVTYSQMRRHDE